MAVLGDGIQSCWCEAQYANARVGVLGFTPTGLNTVTQNGHSSYHALDFTVTRRVGNLFIQSAYTFSKSIDNNSGDGNPPGTQDLGNSGSNNLDTRTLRALRSEEHTSELQSRLHLVCRLLLEKKKNTHPRHRIVIAMCSCSHTDNGAYTAPSGSRNHDARIRICSPARTTKRL